MACSIIPFKAHFNWHLAQSLGHNRNCYDTEGKLYHIVEVVLHILSDSKVNSSLKESTKPNSSQLSAGLNVC